MLRTCKKCRKPIGWACKGIKYFVRVLSLTFMLLAGMASAAPDCSEPPSAQSHRLSVNAPPADLEVNFGKEALVRSSEQDATVSLRPRLRPCKFRLFEVRREKIRERGAVCGDWTIIGETLKPISGKYRGCGVAEPVRRPLLRPRTFSQSPCR